MLQQVDKKLIENLSPKDIMDATYEASKNFQIRAFFEAKKEILEAQKYSEQEFYEILDAMIDAETERRYVLNKMRQITEPLFMEDLVKKISEIPLENVIRDVFYLKEQGYVEEQVEVKTKEIMKTIKGEEKTVEVKEYFYRYITLPESTEFREHYFEPVSIVDEAGVCCRCGFCSAICPVDAIKVDADSLEINDEKCMKCGLCFTVCPRSFSINRAYENIIKLTNSLSFSEKMGGYLSTYSGSTTKDEIKEVRQDGGIVTSLLEYMLTNDIVDAIIAVKHSDKLWKPEPVIVDDIKDLYKTGGTKYANSPSLNLLDKAKEYERVAFVGVPCMMNALVKGSLFPSGLPFYKNIIYKIGLFCYESFSYDEIIKLVKEKFEEDINNLTKMNIDSGKFIINLKNQEEKIVPLKDVQSYARHTCHFCDDLTSEYADISVGSIGAPGGYSAVVIRSKAGEEIYQGAVKAGIIESKELTEVKPGKFLVEKIAGIKKMNCKSIEWDI
ncbi:MAG: Coenzyme F420 hydrogenase subunit beta [Promethearchaeota archaeon]|nr:MAG: Coenzyme F420 hydrogenase subunit beta [Candidatus Lokiarchaeota archaeon]